MLSRGTSLSRVVWRSGLTQERGSRKTAIFAQTGVAIVANVALAAISG
jgi:hypothetical protein